MKKGAVVLVILAVLYFVYLGDEAVTPEYNTVELSFETDRGRPLGLTLAEKMPPDTSCGEGIMTPLATKLKANCGRECRVAFKRCSLDLGTNLRRSFENELLDDPYLSYDKGGVLRQQDFRLIYTGLELTEFEDACLELREMVDNDLMFLVGGHSDCIRKSFAR